MNKFKRLAIMSPDEWDDACLLCSLDESLEGSNWTHNAHCADTNLDASQ
jgi:hypothetical protein